MTQQERKQIVTPVDNAIQKMALDDDDMSPDHPAMARLLDLQSSYRDGVQTERARHDWKMSGKAEWKPGKDSAAYMMTGKAELRMVNVDAAGYKGEHTGREKLERPKGIPVTYSPDHDQHLALLDMCPCAQCGWDRASGSARFPQPVCHEHPDCTILFSGEHLRLASPQEQAANLDASYAHPAPPKPDPSTDPGFKTPDMIRWPFAWPKGWRR